MAEEKQLGRKETADLLLITDRQLANLVERPDGLSKHGSGKHSFYLWSEVLPWYLAYKIKLAAPHAEIEPGKKSLTSAQANKYDVEAQRAEIKLARERGEVVSIADVEKALAQTFGVVRNRILQMPSKLAPLLVGIKTATQARAKVEVEAHECLAELHVTAGLVSVDGNVPDGD